MTLTTQITQALDRAKSKLAEGDQIEILEKQQILYIGSPDDSALQPPVGASADWLAQARAVTDWVEGAKLVGAGSSKSTCKRKYLEIAGEKQSRFARWRGHEKKKGKRGKRTASEAGQQQDQVGGGASVLSAASQAASSMGGGGGGMGGGMGAAAPQQQQQQHQQAAKRPKRPAAAALVEFIVPPGQTGRTVKLRVPDGRTLVVTLPADAREGMRVRVQVSPSA